MSTNIVDPYSPLVEAAIDAFYACNRDDWKDSQQADATREMMARALAAAGVEELRATLENVPLPKTDGTPAEFYGRFYTWLKRERDAALARSGALTSRDPSGGEV